MQLQRYAEAAPLLDALAQQATLQTGIARSALRSGRQYVAAGGRCGKAEFSFSERAGSFAGRCRDPCRPGAGTRDAKGLERAPNADLSAALMRDADRTDLLVLRASARHAQGRKKEARADIDQALGYISQLWRRAGGARRYEI